MRFGLVLLGYGPTEVKAFQAAAGLTVDGDAGPKTRAAIHAWLKALSAAPFEPAPAPAPSAPIADGPATTTIAGSLIAAIVEKQAALDLRITAAATEFDAIREAQAAIQSDVAGLRRAAT